MTIKRILIITTDAAEGGLPQAAAGAEVERHALPAPDAPAERWDALVARLLAADVVITD